MAADNLAGLNIQYGRVGPQTLSDGNLATVRLERTGALVTANRGGLYAEAVARGNVYIGAVKSFTVTASGVAPFPATTGVAILGILNPLGSTKNLSLLKVGIANVSGTPGGPLYFDTLTAPAITATFASTNPTNALTLAKSGSTGLVVAGTTTGALSATMATLRTIGGAAALTLGSNIASLDEFLDGSVLVPPNTLLLISAHATGTSHVLSGYLAWEEIPV